MDLINDNMTLIVASVACLLSFFCFVLLRLKQSANNKRLSHVEQQSQVIESIKSTLKQHDELLNELKMVTQGISKKLTTIESREPDDMAHGSELRGLREQIQVLESKLHNLEAQDPTSRLYTKASKLVASGATVEEIMQECDLPRAEAELVMSLHAKK